MEIEESAVPQVESAADIPAWARITSVIPTFQSGERRAIVQFNGQGPNRLGGEPISSQEVIEW